jgi:hypothetical protein
MGTNGSGSDVKSDRVCPESRRLVSRLRALSLRALARMYEPDARLFVFRVRRVAGKVVAEGLSPRYTAITLIGLATDGMADAWRVLGSDSPTDVSAGLLERVTRADNLGDLALSLWAAQTVGYGERQVGWRRLAELRPADQAHPIVEVAWALTALCLDPEAPSGDLRQRLAHRLISAFDPRSAIFPHAVGEPRAGLRSHVACFADLVYPIHALANYAKVYGDRVARDVAAACARQMCRRQGPAGQWWWHYDLRTGAVIEPYPVYAVHQDAMAPMALFALDGLADPGFVPAVEKGLAWLARAPELHGQSLIDEQADIVWRKVARREPGKLTRYVQSIATRGFPGLRVPGLDRLFPPGAVDFEDRPYHLGWLLYAWAPEHGSRWGSPIAST